MSQRKPTAIQTRFYEQHERSPGVDGLVDDAGMVGLGSDGRRFLFFVVVSFPHSARE